MTAQRLDPGCDAAESNAICELCETGTRSLSRVYGFPMDILANHLAPADYEECDLMSATAVQQRDQETNFLGVNVGKVALYELTLAHKKMSTELTDSQWTEYGIYLRNALITLRAFARYLEGNAVDAISTFSPQYSNINSCMQFAILKGIRVLFMESGTNLSHRLGTMRVWDWKVHRLVNPALRYWGESVRNPLSSESAKAVSAHFRQLLSGQHFAVFSAPYSETEGVRKKWSIQSSQKMILMTLSSYDEAYAAMLIDAFPREKAIGSVYRTQAEWLKATTQWVRKRPDVFLVIRVHPRDFPNKREQVRSEQSFVLESLLQDLPANVHVNWPAEGVSLYELFEDTDVILTGWSVTAMEGLVLGIPVVTYDEKLPSYPPDIMWTGRSEQEYFLNIDRALKQGWSIENVTNGFRWLAYNFVRSTVCVSKRFGRHELADQNIFRRLGTRIKNRIPRFGQPIDLLGWRAALPGATLVSQMLIDGYDSIPAARAALATDQGAGDDSEIVAAELGIIYTLLYANSKWTAGKPGLEKNIRRYLESRTGL